MISGVHTVNSDKSLYKGSFFATFSLQFHKYSQQLDQGLGDYGILCSLQVNEALLVY